MLAQNTTTAAINQLEHPTVKQPRNNRQTRSEKKTRRTYFWRNILKRVVRAPVLVDCWQKDFLPACKVEQWEFLRCKKHCMVRINRCAQRQLFLAPSVNVTGIFFTNWFYHNPEMLMDGEWHGAVEMGLCWQDQSLGQSKEKWRLLPWWTAGGNSSGYKNFSS